MRIAFLSLATRVNTAGESMKPVFHHYIVAHTARISILIGMIVTVALALSEAHIHETWLWEWPLFWRMFLVTIPAAGIGYLTGVLFLWPVLGRIALWIQGWPFQEGDEVVLLAGKNRGRMAQVYEVWESRGQVRVELGKQARRKCTDVFCAVLVTRAKGRNEMPNSADE